MQVLREVQIAEGLIKRVYREGSDDDTPPPGSKVIVHYVGTLKSDGSKFDASRDRNQPFEFTIGQGQVIKGWDQGVATMKIGELCQLECSPDMAYGARGSPPKIPANSTLYFEVELLDFGKTNVTDDGKVRKRVLRDGDGHDSPRYGSTLQVVLTARVGDEKGAVIVQHTEPTDLTFSSPVVSHGLDLALKDMKKGERSKIYVKPDYGFGASAGTALNIPANSALFYDVELVSWTNKYPVDWEMKLSEKLDLATELKVVANERFKTRQWAWALAGYTDAAGKLDSLHTAEGEELKRATALRAALNKNASACHMQLKDYGSMLAAANEALEYDSKDAKAWLRKGQAYYYQGQFKDSIEALTTAKTHQDAKCSKDIAKFLKAAQSKHSKIVAKERQLYANMFS